MSASASRFAFLLTLSALSTIRVNAYAWDVNEGASSLPARADYSRLPAQIVPARYYTQAPITPAPAPMSAAVPAADLPAVHAVPSEQPAMAAAAPAYAAPAAAPVAVVAPVTPTMVEQPAYPTAAATMAVPYSTPYTQPSTAPAKPADRFALGVEGYYDRYREHIVDLQTDAAYGGLDASWEHHFSPEWFGKIEGEGDWGNAKYSSISGKISSIDEWSTEGSITGGYDYGYASGNHFLTYLGLGTRYFSDELKGEVTTGNAAGYDRRILQFYVPVGATYRFQAYGMNWAPNLEWDQLVYGHVESRLQNIPGFQELDNNQHSGYGIRGELMMGQTNDRGIGWEAGPFVRYWHIRDSDVDQTPAFTGIEPQNSRLQAGAKLKLLF